MDSDEGFSRLTGKEKVLLDWFRSLKGAERAAVRAWLFEGNLVLIVPFAIPLLTGIFKEFLSKDLNKLDELTGTQH